MENTAMLGGIPARELPTALMGFRKNDVLSYIDQLLAANSQRQQELEANITSLEEALGLEKEDKQKLLGKTKELCDKLTEQEQAGLRLEQELSDARQECAAFKSRLFTAEQEKSILKGEQANLEKRVELLEAELLAVRRENEELEQTRSELLEKSSRLETLEQDKIGLARQIAALDETVEQLNADKGAKAVVLEQAEQQAQERLRQARQDADKIVADANRAAVDLRADAQQEAELRHRELEKSTGEVAESIGSLKTDLAEVERQMNDAYNSLRQAAQRIETAIGQAQQKIDGAAQEQAAFSPPQKPAFAPEPQEQKSVPTAKNFRSAQKPAAAFAGDQTKSLSDLVLEKLARLLGPV